MLVGALYLAIILGRQAVNWFGVQMGPSWAHRLIRAATAAPLLAIGSAPLLDKSDDGVGLFLGLLALAVIKNWDAEEDNGTDGEIHIGCLIGTAFFALVLTAIATGITEGDPEKVIFIAAGAAAAATLILQAGAWWAVHRGGNAVLTGSEEVEQEVERDEEVTQDGTSPVGGRREDWQSDFLRPESSQNASSASAAERPSSVPAPWMDSRGRRPRALIARVFWSMVSFGLMGGAIVTFLYPLIARPDNPHDITAAIMLCTGFAAMAVFTLRKTTPLRQPGFWRETLRPFLISASLFGIGATTTAVAREWNHTYSSNCIEMQNTWAQKREAIRQEVRVRAMGIAIDVSKPPEPPDPAIAFEEGELSERPCLDDEEKTAVVGGLVMSSITFLGLTLFTGRNPRRKGVAEQAA
jgi:hypothetical protein